MARTDNLTNFLNDVSAAIKSKLDDNTPIPAGQFDTKIMEIETVGNYQDKTVNITQNGTQTITPDTSYDALSSIILNVNVPVNVLQSKTYEFTDNAHIVLSPEQGYDGFSSIDLTINVPSTGEDLEAEISAQEEYIAQLEAIIDTKAAGGGSEPNIFVQETEPDIKKGIWLKYNGETEHIYGDDDVVESESWYPDDTFRNIPYEFTVGSAVAIGTDIYLFGDGSTDTNAYKYDTLANTYTKLADIPYEFTAGSVVSIGTDIYILGGFDSANTNTYKYDTLANTYTKLADIPYKFYRGSAVAIGTDIYLFGGTNSSSTYYGIKMAYKYDTLANTYTKLADIPYSFYWGSIVSIGTDIYILGGYNAKTAYNYLYKYDTLTNTYTKLADIPYKFYRGSAVAIGTDIYLFGGTSNTTNAYKYNILTSVWVQLTDIPYSFYQGATQSQLVNYKIFLMGGYDNSTKVQCMQLQTKEYENNSVVISQGRLYNVGYATEIFSNSLMEKPLLYAFADAWFYTTNDGLITDIPTYYGDGTQWINIKNPPVEEVEE